MPKKNEVDAVVIETTKEVEEKQKVAADTPSNSVYVACSLQLGIKFKVTTKDGKIKNVVFPGISQQSRGDNNGGILLDRGSAVLACLPREDWEAVKKQYGSHVAFTHIPPFIRELNSKKDFQSSELQKELKAMRTGSEPIITDPTEEQKRTEKNVLDTAN